ncbi:MAG: M3 family oligoendopeptidase [Thermodesulfobacteriota bacterium]
MGLNDNYKGMNWDLTSYFPEFKGDIYNDFKKSLIREIETIKKEASTLNSLMENNLSEWKSVFLATEELIKRYSHISSYVGCLSAADSNNEKYISEDASISLLGSELEKLEVELKRAVKGVDKNIFNRFISSKELQSAGYYLERVYKQAEYSMEKDKEMLASDLGVDGISAWGRLYDTVSSKMTFEMNYPDGTTKTLPMSQRRSLMENPDREIRKAAFEGGNSSWKQYEDIAASSLNAISGTRHTLYKHRSVDHFLDIALFDSAISKETLDAMIEAIYESVEVPKNILRQKAKSMGLDSIAWYDLGAPVKLETETNINWEDAKSKVSNSFSASYKKLGGFINHMYENEWIDWEVRKGKRPGGFCTGSLLTTESRIFMTYNESIGDILTLAHEAGHAFHSHVMKEIRPYKHFYPMTLAETASTFGEMLLIEGLINDPNISDKDKVMLLDAEVNHGAIYLMDIPVRYEFEKKVYEERKDGELSVSRFKELMIETQKEVFGEVLSEYDPYFWASKLHFYITGVSFYNFPYTFGYLLSRYLFSKFKENGKEFLPVYEDFLKLTGSDNAEGVVKRTIGDDITKKEFWVNAIKTLKEPHETLNELLPKVL